MMNRKHTSASQRVKRQRRISFMELSAKGNKPLSGHTTTPAYQYKPRQSEQ